MKDGDPPQTGVHRPFRRQRTIPARVVLVVFLFGSCLPGWSQTTDAGVGPAGLVTLMIGGFLLAFCGYLTGRRNALSNEGRTLALARRAFSRRQSAADEFLDATCAALREPLTEIQKLVQSRETISDPGRQAQAVALHGRRLSALIDDLEHFANLKRKSPKLDRRAVDLPKLVERALIVSESFGAKRAVALINAVPDGLPCIDAEESHLLQALRKLVEYAVSVSHASTLAVDAQIQAEEVEIHLSFRTDAEEAQWLASVFESKMIETGESFPGEDREMGLQLARNFIALHGSRLVLETEKNGECRFVFLLPAATAVTPMPEPESGAAVNPGPLRAKGPRRILVVDDEPVNCQVLNNYLAIFGYDVVRANCGRKALDILAEGNIDLVILDIMMPEMSGYEVCREIRRTSPAHELPVLFLTVKDQEYDLVAGFSAGGNDYLTKPVSKNELLWRVRTHLQLLDSNRKLESMVDERTRELHWQTLVQEEKNRQLEYMNREREAVDDIVKSVNRETTLDAVLQTMLDRMVELFPRAEGGAVLLLDPNYERFRFAATVGMEDEDTESLDFDFKDLLNRYTHGAECVGDGAYLVRNPSRLVGLTKRPAPRVMLSMTLIIDGETQGFLVLDNYTSVEAFDRGDVRKLVLFREHAVTAVAKAQLVQQLDDAYGRLEESHDSLLRVNQQLELASITDPLTGMKNRRYLARHIEMDISQVKREVMHAADSGRRNPDLVFMLMDLDYFKEINDLYGHTAGDLVLLQVRDILSAACRKSDMLVRWGGEEFLIVTRFTDRQAASLAAERIRHAVSQYDFALGEGRTVKRTCSLGYACYPFFPDDVDAVSWEQVIDMADQALYLAKGNGRNAWVGFHSTAGTPRDNLTARVREDGKELLKLSKLDLETSIESDEPLTWISANRRTEPGRY